MKLVPQSAPYIRKPVSVARMMTDVIIALLPVTVFAMIQNGWSSIYVLLLSLVTMIGSELIANMFIKWPRGMKFKELFSKDGFDKLKEGYTINNFLAPTISALIYALILPAKCAPYIVFVGALFGMVIGKMVFGGLGKNVFNPAAVGRIFVAICFGSKLNEAYPNQVTFDVAAGATPLGFTKTSSGLALNAIGNYSLLDLFLGNVPGCMGEVSALCILIGGIYLFYRKSADIRAALSYLLSFGVVMFAAVVTESIVKSGNIMEMWAYQMLSGGLLFGAVFMVTDPVTSGTTKFSRIAFGITAGLLTALIRVIGAYPEGVAFSILIANMLAPCFDYINRGKPNKVTWKQALALGCVVLVIGTIIVINVCYAGGVF
jgi:electron transport complex protein RnfD